MTVALWAVLARAGDREISGSVGFASTGHDEGSVGKGVAGGFAVGWHGDRRLGVEFDYGYSQNKRDDLFSGRTHTALGNVLVHFGKSRAQPYLLGGGGLLHHTNLGGRVFGFRNESRASLAGAVGFGVKAFINDHWFVRPEVRVTLTSSFDSVARASVGIGYRW